MREFGMGNPVIWFEIISADAAKLRDFYGSVFGWTFNADNPFNYGIADTGAGSGIGGGVGAPMGPGAGYVTFYVSVPDIDAALAQITARGGKIVQPKTTVPNGPTLAHFSDPSGHRIGLLEANSMGGSAER
jgi:uncharacterized protein